MPCRPSLPSKAADRREGPEVHKMDDAEQKIFSSDHLYLVAFLVCSGHHIIGSSRRGMRTSFEFRKTPAISNDVARFMSGGAVPARQFSFELLKLKRTLSGGK